MAQVPNANESVTETPTTTGTAYGELYRQGRPESLTDPKQLLNLLVGMARNKLAFQARKERAQCRDGRRAHAATDDQFIADEASPSRQVAAAELLQEVQRRLSPEERQLAELRHQGLEWSQIAEQVGGSPEALRKKLARAVDRVARALGLDDLLSN